MKIVIKKHEPPYNPTYYWEGFYGKSKKSFCVSAWDYATKQSCRTSARRFARLLKEPVEIEE